MEIDAIVEQVLAGDVDAFGGIVDRYQAQVWRIVAYAMRDNAATEDMVQQIFVSAFLGLGRFDRTRDLGAWIRTVARNRVRRYLRDTVRHRRRRRLYEQWLHTQKPEQESHTERMEAQLLALERCKQKLAPPAAVAVEMRYGRAHSYESIAATLQRTVPATRQLLTRARAALRRCMQRQGANA